LPDLEYDHGELEPVISGRIMELHHKKHHAAYITNLNKAVAALDAKDAADEATKPLKAALRFNGGGHINHSMFWKSLAPKSKAGGVLPGMQSTHPHTHTHTLSLSLSLSLSLVLLARLTNPPLLQRSLSLLLL
jgi:superoxide dismutase